MKTVFLLLLVSLASGTARAQSSLSAGPIGPGGAFQIMVGGGPQQIEWTTNLSTWTSLSNGRGSIIDAASTNSDWRFYRAKPGGGAPTNVVGFVRVSVPAGKLNVVASPFAEPLRLSDKNVRTAVFGTATPLAQVYLMKDGKQSAYTFDEFDNNWQPPLPEIPWGNAFTVRNLCQAPVRLTFTGELPQGNLNLPIPTGEALIAPLVPKPGPVEEALASAPVDGAQIMLWNDQTQQYQTTTFNSQQQRWVPTLTYKPGLGVVVKFPAPSFKTTFNPAK